MVEASGLSTRYREDLVRVRLWAQALVKISCRSRISKVTCSYSYHSSLQHLRFTLTFKGILKKSPYCPIDKDRWDERMSSSSQNNLVNLTSGHSTLGPRSDSRRDISDVERTLKSLNGYHEDILEVNFALQTYLFFHICFSLSSR